ncbi:GTP-binding protein rhoC [Penicillium verhagenii]|nr:GTP-binding protein rhoC [Penicillium verhagenii]
MSQMYDDQYYAASRRRSVATPPPSHEPRHSRTRSHSVRVSNGTASTNTSFSSGRMSEATNITQPPSYSKKICRVFENYITQTVHRASGKTVELALWDTAGQEEYDRLRPLSYPETDLLFVCFAIDCPASLENVVDKWYPEVLHFCPTTPIILVGLKSDLRNKRTCIELLKTQGLTPITPEQGEAVAHRMGASYVECSSKEMRGVDDVFAQAVDTVVETETESWKPTKQSLSSSNNRNSVKPSGGGGGPGKKIKKRSCKIL